MERLVGWVGARVCLWDTRGLCVRADFFHNHSTHMAPTTLRVHE